MSVRVEYGDGRNRSFGVRQPETYGATQTQVLGDFDGDGKLDLALALNSDEDTFRIWMLRNNGTRFERPTLWFTQETWQANYDLVRPGDFDKDGKDDLAVFRDQAFDRLPKSQLTLLTSSGAGFTPSARTRALPDTGELYTRPVTGDFDGDGNVDVALVNQARTRDVITVHHWGPNGFDRGTVWSDESHSAARQGASVSVGDYDGDGSDDLALVNNLSEGKFVIAVQLSSGIGVPRAGGLGVVRREVAGRLAPVPVPCEPILVTGGCGRFSRGPAPFAIGLGHGSARSRRDSSHLAHGRR